MSLVVRPATEADARAVAEVHVAGWRAGYRGLLPDAYLDALSVDDRVAGWASGIATGPAVSLAQADDEVLGFVSYGACRDDDVPEGTGEVFSLYVRPQAWGRGVGGLLLETAREALTQRGRVTHVLWTLHDNVRAQQFYERRGWVADGAVKTDRRPGLVLEEVRHRHA